MILEKTTSDGWLSNSWLVADRAGGHAVLIDAGGPTGPILAAIDRLRVTLTHVLCTHHHVDHVQHGRLYRSRFGCPVCAHARERELCRDLDTDLADGDELASGDLRVRALHTPGHTRGMLAFLVNESLLFTGDTLFRGSVGGTTAPGHGTFEELRHSVMEILMRLPHETAVHPGHTESTTIGEEWERNPFVLAWRGRSTPRAGRCSALGRPAELLLSARDYDGGSKCWVRYDDGRMDVVPGSRVEAAGG